MKKIILTVACIAASTIGAHADVLAGYDFTNGTAATASPGPVVYTSAIGTSTLYLDGTHGSSSYVAASEISGFGGTTLNTTGTTLSTSTTSPSALAILGGTATGTPATYPANGKSFVFTLSTTGYSSLVLTYATQRTSTGFATQAFSYSLDGTTFTPFTSITAVPTAFAVQTVDFTPVTALNNAATVYIQGTLTGATSASGNNRFDNFQFNASPVPEPSTYVMLIAGVGAMALVYRRKAGIKA